MNLGERWSPDGKAKFRDYFRHYFEALGATVEVQQFPVPNLVGETTGHNIEAVLPGASPDSLVIISHYDSLGLTGHEKDNAGADDAGSGLAMMLESARLFAAASDRQCSGDKYNYDYPELARGIIDVAAHYSKTMMPTNECDGSAETDHYPFWPAGIPAYAIVEFGAENNPHYDDTGDDTLAHIDFPMLAEISRIQIQYQSELAGIH